MFVFVLNTCWITTTREVGFLRLRRDFMIKSTKYYGLFHQVLRAFEGHFHQVLRALAWVSHQVLRVWSVFSTKYYGLLRVNSAKYYGCSLINSTKYYGSIWKYPPSITGLFYSFLGFPPSITGVHGLEACLEKPRPGWIFPKSAKYYGFDIRHESTKYYGSRANRPIHQVLRAFSGISIHQVLRALLVFWPLLAQFCICHTRSCGFRRVKH